MKLVKNTIKELIFRLLQYLVQFYRRVDHQQKALRFKARGENLIFNANDFFSYEHISVGNSVLIGQGAKFLASNSQIIIGNKVLFGPNVTLIGGNHTTSRVGIFMFDVTDEMKDKNDDADIVIKDDVWVGANVTILNGVTVDRGCVIGAGSIVTKSIPAYSIAVGIPAKPIKMRFSIDEITDHERRLYPEHLRINRSDLEDNLAKIKLDTRYLGNR